MFGLKDKALAIIAGSIAMVLAGVLVFTLVGKNATISTLRDELTTAQGKVDNLTADLTQCRANRITLEEATRRQNEAVEAATEAMAARLEELGTVTARAASEAAAARARADRILSAQGTGDVCQDADALILEEAGQ